MAAHPTYCMFLFLLSCGLSGCWGIEITQSTEAFPSPPQNSDSKVESKTNKSEPGGTLPTDNFSYSSAPFAKGSVWKISHRGQIKGYVLGTFHIGKWDQLAVPQFVFERLPQSARLIVEITPGSFVTSRGEAHRSLANGLDLQALLDYDSLQTVQRLARSNGVDMTQLQKLKPWVVLAMLQFGSFFPEKTMDDHLIEIAKKQKIDTLGLESMDEQLEAADCATLDSQVLLMQETLKYAGDFQRVNERMLELYRTKEMGSLLDFAIHGLPLSKEAKAVEALDIACLLNQRNPRMVERLERLMGTGESFVAIGVFHLVGNDGILCQLQRKGYDISSAVNQEKEASNACKPNEPGLCSNRGELVVLE